MFSIVLLAALTLTLSLLLTPVVRRLCLRWALVDNPGGRKVHRNPTPRAGGIAVVLSCLLAYGIILGIGTNARDLIWAYRGDIGRLSISAFLVFLLGLLDDIYSLRALSKLGGEALAAVAAYAGGVHIHSINGYTLDPWLSLPLTVAWLLACTNALNLIDGLDGLACGIGIFATGTALLGALLQHNIGLALAVVPLLAALLGFLRYNYNPATIFLGDSGSLFIGFLLGCYGILWTQKSATLLGMTAPLMAFALPLLDTALAIFRRFLHNKPIFSPDRGHIHHRLLDRGFHPRKVVLILYAFCGLGALCSFGVANSHTAFAAAVAFAALVWIGVSYLGYAEFDVLGRLFHPRTFSRMVAAQMRIHGLEDALASASTVDECWIALRGATQELGFSELAMRFDETFYQEHFCPPSQDSLQRWTIRIPIAENGFINVGHNFEHPVPAMVIAPLADTVRRVLEPKLPSLTFPVHVRNRTLVVHYGNAS